VVQANDRILLLNNGDVVGIYAFIEDLDLPDKRISKFLTRNRKAYVPTGIKACGTSFTKRYGPTAVNVLVIGY